MSFWVKVFAVEIERVSSQHRQSITHRLGPLLELFFLSIGQNLFDCLISFFSCCLFSQFMSYIPSCHLFNRFNLNILNKIYFPSCLAIYYVRRGQWHSVKSSGLRFATHTFNRSCCFLFLHFILHMKNEIYEHPQNNDWMDQISVEDRQQFFPWLIPPLPSFQGLFAKVIQRCTALWSERNMGTISSIKSGGKEKRWTRSRDLVRSPRVALTCPAYQNNLEPIGGLLSAADWLSSPIFCKPTNYSSLPLRLGGAVAHSSGPCG